VTRRIAESLRAVVGSVRTMVTSSGTHLAFLRPLNARVEVERRVEREE